ncbi:MAG: right-handed parallel beta-helix repeat-containing protein, partial [Candidatus Omnitrophota bacterium]|nr:right-handed parallel beta-helix repeat-containing protein [Candidatus Omnitrophota bacterium]
AQSPYIVVGSINVLQAITLTIEPGVQIKFAGSFSLTVNGSLIAQGNQTNPITFSSSRQTPAIGDWQGIQFTDSSDDLTCIISYAIIEYSSNGINTNNASPRIENNTIRNNQNGIYCEYYSLPAITNNTIINNAYGIYTSGSLTNYPNPTINNNSIYNNSSYNLYTYATNNCSSLTINAQNNWWGTVDVITITQKIYDYTDNPNFPAVDFIPFLDGPNGNPIEGNFVLGPINQNTTWTQAQSPYIVVGSINVLQAITLTIEPGVQIKFAGSFSLTVNGSLIAQGTQTNPITFTSNRQTPAIGDWQQINFTDTSDDVTCIISYAIIEYSDQGIHTYRASPRIEQNTLQNNNRGIYCENSSSSAITNNTIINNAYGIYTSGSLFNYPNPTINNNSIYNNIQYNLYAYASNNCSSLTINAQNNWWGTIDPVVILQTIYDNLDNSYSPVVDFMPFLDGPNGNPIEGTLVYGPINTNTTWTLVNSPYIVVGNITINQNRTLTIQPGVQVKFAGNFSLIVWGSLIASGTESQPITFTSNRQTPAIGDWQYILFTNISNDATCIISYAVVEYSNQGIYAQNASPRIEHNTLQNNNRGIYCEYRSSLTIIITNNTIINNAYGIYTSGSLTNYPNPFINNNSIYNNTQYNLYAYASNNCSSLTINAEYNWWGTMDSVLIRQSIYDHADNPNSPVVDFIPYLDGPNGNPVFQITNVSVNPHSFNPSNNERVNINYTLDRNADVTITIQNLSYNAIRTIGPNPKLAGANSDVWDGRNAAGEIVADNAYTFTIEAIAGTIFGEYTPEYIPNPVGVTGFTVDTDFNPHNNELCRIDYNLADYAEVLIRVGEAGGGGANWPIIDWRPRIPGLNTDYWNGRDPNGRIVNLNTVTFAIWTRALPDEPIIVVSDFTVSVSTDPYSIIPSYREFTTITYNISQTANVTVSVYDIDGALVKVLEDNAPKPAGTYVLTWDGTNSQGRVVPQEGNFTVMVEARSGSGRLATAFGNVTVH